MMQRKMAADKEPRHSGRAFRREPESSFSFSANPKLVVEGRTVPSLRGSPILSYGGDEAIQLLLASARRNAFYARRREQKLDCFVAKGSSQ
jgi:hypothetical protein